MKSFLQKNENVVLGKVQGSLWRNEEISEAQMNHHVHIVGASGFGKTVLLSQIIRQRIAQGKGLLFIDLKGDIDTVLQFTQYAAQADRVEDLAIFSISNEKISQPYNILGNGTANQLRDKIMLSLNWSEEFYKNLSASYLLKCLIGLVYLRDHSGLNLNLSILLKAVSDPQYVAGLVNQIPIGESKIRMIFEECFEFLSSSDNHKSIQGLRTQIESLVLSDFGSLISSDEKGIDLFEAVKAGKIILLFLDSRRYGETAKIVGKFILQDLKSVSARIDSEVPKESRKPFTVIIDEFADLAQEDFIGFLDRARSSKFGIILAHQEICDLLRISPEFAGRLMGNTSTLYAFLQKRPESAEIISKMAGTKKVYKETYQSEKILFLDVPTGNKSLREVEEFHIHPNLIKSLKVGQCVCVKKYPKARAYTVRISNKIDY